MTVFIGCEVGGDIVVLPLATTGFTPEGTPRALIGPRRGRRDKFCWLKIVHDGPAPRRAMN
jgi:hypothetical protein